MAPTTKTPTLTAQQVEKIERAQLGVVIEKTRQKKPLNSREWKLLAKYGGTKPPEETPDEDRVWVTPAELERYLPTVNITISKKNLYKTYLGKGARHPLERSGDGKRIHKHKAAELIRIVQGRDDTSASRVIQERQLADARYRSAKARREEILLQQLMGDRIPLAAVEKVWARALENFFNELRAMEHNAPEELFGKDRAEMRAILQLRHHEARKHLMINMRPESKQEGAA